MPTFQGMPKREWIVIADASRARVFEHVPKRRPPWALVLELENPEGREQGPDLMPNRGARIQHTREKTARGRLQPQSLHEVEAQRFAGELLHELKRGLAAHRFDSLVLVAPPKFLGMLRDGMSGPLTRRVRDTLAKDFSKLDGNPLHERLDSL